MKDDFEVYGRPSPCYAAENSIIQDGERSVGSASKPDKSRVWLKVVKQESG
jgi:hypothetical protein